MLVTVIKLVLASVAVIGVALATVNVLLFGAVRATYSPAVIPPNTDPLNVTGSPGYILGEPDVFV